MRMSQAEKGKSHQRIVASASRLLRERGVDGASVSDVMKDAGLTHGGFYKHFPSKDAMVASALDVAFEPFIAMLDSADANAGTAYRDLYLSGAHVSNPGIGCPIAALSQDIARGSEELKGVFGHNVDQLTDALAETMDGPAAVRKGDAIRQLCMLVGAVVVARACDPKTAEQVLSAVATTDRRPLPSGG